MKLSLKGIKRGSERLYKRQAEKAKELRMKKKKKAQEFFELSCNICNRFFSGVSPLFRFCRRCKESSELFRFHDSLPAGTI